MIPHNAPCLDDKEEAAATAVLRSGWLAQGAQVAAFENELCGFLGLPEGHGVAVSSGSAALYLALLAVGARCRRVAFPAYSCRSLLNAVELAGALPEYIDNAPGSPNLDLTALNASPAEIAIVPHMFGIPVDFRASGRIVIEDCAQALGAAISGLRVGTLGAIGLFSFGATKPITAGGQGGMLVSRDAGIIDFLRRARDYDTVPDSHPRFNLQMTDLQAAIGRVQLEKLPEFMARRERLFQRYRSAGLSLLEADAAASPLRFRAIALLPQPTPTQELLRQAGICAIIPVTEDELLAPSLALPRARAMTRTTLSLPLYPALTDAQVGYISNTLSEACS